MKISTQLKKLIKMPVKVALNTVGFDLVRYSAASGGSAFPPDFTSNEIEDYLAVRPFTLTSPERVISLIRSVEYVVTNKIPGDIVECGVWKGGSMMAVAKTLLRLKSSDRHLYLFDTYEGMSKPTGVDVSVDGEKAMATWQKDQSENQENEFTFIPLDQVKKKVLEVGYDSDRVHFVKGKVEDTIPAQAPDQISLLRLDTDWYESTLHELNHLFSRVSPGGVVIIDDYGHWAGARKATDEFLKKTGIPLLLNRIDYTGRIAVKL
ncbi:MAG: TylF/MycF/NovP-related O-methyltransferase [Bdellovibrionota bacterium]